MTSSVRKMCCRKATWLAFGLLALATFTSATDPITPGAVPNAQSETPNLPTNDVPITNKDFDPSAEANRAFRKAMTTLHNLTQDQLEYTFDPSSAFSTYSSRSIFASLLPNPEGHGPISSALRLISRLQENTLVQTVFSTLLNPGGNAKQARREQDLKRKSVKVLDLLQLAVELGHLDATYALAQVSMFPPNDHFPSDPGLAYHSLLNHATATGNATSQALLAFFHSTGYRDIVPVNQALAQLYYTFAANGGHKGAQMGLGYRYLSGIGTEESCENALRWYEYASEQSIARFLSGPAGGRTLPLTGTRLSDLVGGVYGYGSSVASTGTNTLRPGVKAGIARAAGETWEEVMEYYLFNANRGELDFAYRLGKIYYQGSIYHAAGGIASGGEGVGAVPQSFQRSMHYFMLIARKMWPRDPTNPLHDNPSEIKDENDQITRAILSAGYIGRMYLRGEGVKRDYGLATMWFRRGAQFGDRESQNGLGILWRDGLVPGHKDSFKTAVKYFNLAADELLAESLVHLAKLHYENAELQMAANFFDNAIRAGSTFEAFYYLGVIQSSNVKASAGGGGPSVSGSCGMAVSFHKQVAERGSWGDDLVHEGEIAWTSGTDRGKEVAMLKWWIAAERGQEIAQNNLAYVLDQDRSILRLTRFSPITPSNDTALLALTQWTRAASQRNVDALVKVGDYYYHGLGVPPDSEADRYEKAAKYYQSAADTQMSALAMWNLGWMYENGIGVPQDFHLAKRNYDFALTANPDASLPIILSLVKLYSRSFWHSLQGGQGGLSIFDFEGFEEEGSASDQQHAVPEIDPSHQEDDGGLLDDSDESWYLGKAREDLKRRASAQRDEDTDAVEWARGRRLQDQAEEGDFGPEDYFEGASRGGNREHLDDDDFSETVLLVLLCLMVSILIYVRTRIVEERRNQNPPQNGNDAPPANPGRAWVP